MLSQCLLLSLCYRSVYCCRYVIAVFTVVVMLSQCLLLSLCYRYVIAVFTVVVMLSQCLTRTWKLFCSFCLPKKAQPVPPELVSRLLGNRVAVSPIVTIEPRRRKFHRPITLTMPLPRAAQKGMLNQYGTSNSSTETPTLRLLCSIMGEQCFCLFLVFLVLELQKSAAIGFKLLMLSRSVLIAHGDPNIVGKRLCRCRVNVNWTRYLFWTIYSCCTWYQKGSSHLRNTYYRVMRMFVNW